ncbi:MAG: hypothetical protein GY849_13295, partial [Deltaproteobacteria bacterium]|nr:hypothetical protein [Deltaproteobacteria bacterium]
MDRTKYQKIFIEESEKYLKALETCLIEVEKDLLNTALWTEIHGKIHSIKGMARALSLEKISHLSHTMEGWCKQFQQGALEATPEAVQLIFDGGDLLKFLVTRMGEMGSAQDRMWYDTLLGKFKKGPEELDTGDPPKSCPLPRPFVPPHRIDYVRVKYSIIEELLGISQEIMLLEK